jgi:SAM-dependent methyltransferase
VIDRVKRVVSSRLTLPCPPYENHEYWEGVYRNLGPSDVFEWGGVSFEQLDTHRYNATNYAHELIPHGYPYQKIQEEEEEAPQDMEKDWKETTFGEAIGVDPVQDGKRILLLGCGNSKLGEEMVQMGGWTGPIVHTDISARVISTMSERCHSVELSSSGANNGDNYEDVLSFVQDDAAQLSAFEDASIHGCVDKGLVDALFCASHPVSDILESVHRVLVPGGIFCLFSLSRPEFILPQILPPLDDSSTDDSTKCQTMWNNIQIRQLDSILMYRYQKAHPAPPKPKQTTERTVLQLSNRKQKRSKIKPLSNRRQ